MTDDRLADLYDAAKRLPGGSMRGGTRLAAVAFVERLRTLEDPDIDREIEAAAATADGAWRDWLLAQRTRGAAPAS